MGKSDKRGCGGHSNNCGLVLQATGVSSSGGRCCQLRENGEKKGRDDKRQWIGMEHVQVGRIRLPWAKDCFNLPGTRSQGKTNIILGHKDCKAVRLGEHRCCHGDKDSR